MGCPNRVRYKLPWPGLRTINIYIIDNNDIVYGMENHLPPGRRHLNQLDYQYVKLHSIMSHLTEQERYRGNMCLNKLIADFGMRSMRTIACCSSTIIGQQVIVDQYLPVTTLLPFLMIFPSKTFKVLYDTVLDFLDNYLDMPCINCGFINRNCMCLQNEPISDSCKSVGFAISYCDKESQTLEDTTSKSPPSIPPPPPLQCMEKMSKAVTAKAKTKKGTSMSTPCSSVKVTSGAMDSEPPTIMTGVGGIKIKIPPEIKLQPGTKLPLTMIHGPEGPCLIPDSISQPVVMPTVPTAPMTAPMHGFTRPMSGLPMTNTLGIPPSYGNMGQQMYPLGPPSGYTSINMPPPLYPPMGPIGMTDPSLMLPPLPPLPPQSLPGLPSSPMMYTNLPIMANYSSSAYDPGKNPTDYGPPRGQVTVRLPKNLNPKYINTILGTFKRMSGTRNIGIQVETIILPKKKSALTTSVELNSKKPPTKDKVAKDQGSDVKKDGSSKSTPKGKKIISVDSSYQKSVITQVDNETSVGEENKFKVPNKKVDKVWRMIVDDEDSDEEKEKTKEDGKSNDEGKDLIKSPNEKIEMDDDVKTEGKKVDDALSSDGIAPTVDGEVNGKEDEHTESSVIDVEGSDAISTDAKKNSADVNETGTDVKEGTSDVLDVKSAMQPCSAMDTAGSDTETVGAEDTRSDAGKIDVDSLTDDSPHLSQVDDGNTSCDDSVSATSVSLAEHPNDNNQSMEGDLKITNMDVAMETDVKKSPTKVSEGVSDDINPAVSTTAQTPSPDAPASVDVRVSPSSDVTSAEEALRRSLAVEALESLASMGRVDTVKATEVSDEGKDKPAVTQSNNTETPSVSEEASAALTPTSDPSTQDKAKLDESTVCDVDDDEEPELVIDEDKLNDKPTEGGNDDGSEKKPEDAKLEKKKNPFDIFRVDSPVKPSRPNFDHEKKYFAKFEHLPTGEKLYKCTFPRCTQCFDTRAGAKMHNQCHSKDETVRHMLCLECDYRTPFFKWFDLLRHLRETHSMGLSEEPNGCLFCGLVFETQDRLARHMDFHYSSRYKCVHCGMMMMSWGQVKQHVENCPERDQTKVNFGCPHCMFVFHKRTIRNLHMLSHSDKGLTCALCEDSDINWEHWKLLRKHYQTRHAKVLTGKIGPFRDLLPMKKRNPKCHICAMEFKASDLFNVHMVKVHDFIPYTLLPCHLCSQPFRTKRRLDYHVKNAHDQEAQCDECDFVAKNKTFLKMHISQKHSEKQHLCTECGKSFVYYHQLRIHMAHHARKIVHSCKHCEEQFTRSTELRKHIAEQHTQTGEKKAYNCDHCEYWTYTRSTLAYHVSKKHNRSMDDQDLSGDMSGELDILSDQNQDPSDQMYPESYTSVPKKRKYTRDPSKSLRGGRGRKKQKRLTMPSRRPYTPRQSKENEVTSVQPLKRWIPEKPVRDREERKRIRLEEDEQRKLKRMRRDSSARTRSLEMQKAIQDDIEMDIFEDEQMELAKSRGLLVPGKKYNRSVSRDECMIINLTYPYIDHNYYKLETQSDVTSFKSPGLPGYSRRHYPYSGADYSMPDFSTQPVTMDVVVTPSVSGFEECETSPGKTRGGKTRGYNRRSSNTSSKYSSPNLPSFLTEMEAPAMSSTPIQSSVSKLHSPVQIRSLLTRALQASPTKGNRDKVSALSQQLKSIAMDIPSLEDFPELISEAGEMLPEQDLGLITDILNSMDTASINIGSRLSDGVSPSNDLSLPLADQSTRSMFNNSHLPFAEEPPQSLEVPAALARGSVPVVPTITTNPAVTVEVIPKVPDVRENSSFEETMLDTSGTDLPTELPSDLDEIELKEADYQLWHDSPQPANETPDTDFDDSLASAQIIVEFKNDGNSTSNKPALVLQSNTGAEDKAVTVSHTHNDVNDRSRLVLHEQNKEPTDKHITVSSASAEVERKSILSAAVVQKDLKSEPWLMDHQYC